MLSLCVKIFEQIGIDIDKSDKLIFLDEGSHIAWDKLVGGLYKLINDHFVTKVKEERTNGELTFINYSKNATFLSELLRQKVDSIVISNARALTDNK